MKPQIWLTSILLIAGCASSARPKEATENMPDLVALSEIDPTIIQDIRYASNHNFIGRPIQGYAAPKCILTREAALALARAQRDLNNESLSLKVYDCYRPQQAVDEFVTWAGNLGDVKMKKEFYPQVDKTRLFQDGYIAAKSGHSRGSTVDLTIVPSLPSADSPFVEGQKLKSCFLPRRKRFPDNSLDMGTGYDCFDPRAHTASSQISVGQKRNRLLLKSTMEKFGFKALDEEWWHFTLKNEPYPDSYFNTEIR